MTPQQVREMLRETLDDRRLSRGEKQAMSRIFEHLEPGSRALSLYRSMAFELARSVPPGPDSPRVMDWLEDVIALLESRSSPEPESAAPEVCFSPQGDCPGRIAGMFRSARAAADVCVFTITDDRISDAMLAAHERGIRIRVITDNDKSFDAGSDIDRLARAGVPVRVDRSEYHMHHKFAIFDGRRLLNGSYNWTRGAAEWNEENFVISSDPRMIAPFADLFETLWDRFG